MIKILIIIQNYMELIKYLIIYLNFIKKNLLCRNY
jgi:hypothetical protein